MLRQIGLQTQFQQVPEEGRELLYKRISRGEELSKGERKIFKDGEEVKKLFAYIKENDLPFSLSTRTNSDIYYRFDQEQKSFLIRQYFEAEVDKNGLTIILTSSPTFEDVKYITQEFGRAPEKGVLPIADETKRFFFDALDYLRLERDQLKQLIDRTRSYPNPVDQILFTENSVFRYNLSDSKKEFPVDRLAYEQRILANPEFDRYFFNNNTLSEINYSVFDKAMRACQESHLDLVRERLEKIERGVVEKNLRIFRSSDIAQDDLTRSANILMHPVDTIIGPALHENGSARKEEMARAVQYISDLKLNTGEIIDLVTGSNEFHYVTSNSLLYNHFVEKCLTEKTNIANIMEKTDDPGKICKFLRIAANNNKLDELFAGLTEPEREKIADRLFELAINEPKMASNCLEIVGKDKWMAKKFEEKLNAKVKQLNDSGLDDIYIDALAYEFDRKKNIEIEGLTRQDIAVLKEKEIFKSSISADELFKNGQHMQIVCISEQMADKNGIISYANILENYPDGCGWAKQGFDIYGEPAQNADDFAYVEISRSDPASGRKMTIVINNPKKLPDADEFLADLKNGQIGRPEYKNMIENGSVSLVYRGHSPYNWSVMEASFPSSVLACDFSCYSHNYYEYFSEKNPQRQMISMSAMGLTYANTTMHKILNDYIFNCGVNNTDLLWQTFTKEMTSISEMYFGFGEFKGKAQHHCDQINVVSSYNPKISTEELENLQMKSIASNLSYYAMPEDNSYSALINAYNTQHPNRR